MRAKPSHPIRRMNPSHHQPATRASRLRPRSVSLAIATAFSTEITRTHRKKNGPGPARPASHMGTCASTGYTHGLGPEGMLRSSKPASAHAR